MKTKTINLYSFDELSKEAQDKAVNNLRDINVNYNWWESVYEDAKNIGLNITSFDLDRNRHCKGELNLSANEIAQNIMNDHGQDCETYKIATKFMEEWQPVFNEYMNAESEKYESSESEGELQMLEDEFLTDILEDYSIILQKESEYLQSDESIIETIKANEYTFTESGKLENL